jgi:hypothetical protein
MICQETPLLRSSWNWVVSQAGRLPSYEVCRRRSSSKITKKLALKVQHRKASLRRLSPIRWALYAGYYIGKKALKKHLISTPEKAALLLRVHRTWRLKNLFIDQPNSAAHVIRAIYQCTREGMSPL